jgi:hypothetical protein
VPKYLFSLLVAIDQFVNALLGGYADETISYRSAVAMRRGERWGCVLCKLLDKIDPDHCAKTIVAKLVSLRKRGMI